MSDKPRKLVGAALLLGVVVAVLVHWRRDSEQGTGAQQFSVVPSVNLPQRVEPRAARASEARDRMVEEDSPPLRALYLLLQESPDDVALLGATAGLERKLGRVSSALEHAHAAERAEPSNPDRPVLVGELLAGMRAFPEARAAFDRALALAPTRLELVADKISSHQAEGDLAAADALLKTLPPPHPRDRKLVEVRHRQFLYQRRYADAVWLLDDVFGQAARAKTANGWVRLNFHIEVGRLRELLGHTTASSEYQLALHLDGELRAVDFDAALLGSVLGLTHAGLGNEALAVGAAERHLAAITDDHQAQQGALLRLAEIHARFDDAQAAVGILRDSLATPFGTTTAALRLDPAWAALRGNPKFDALSAPSD